MSMMLADIDATCASLGYFDGSKYIPEPDALQGLKHLIWILRRDGETHEYRRHLGSSKVMESDLLPMMIHQSEENEMSDVLLRLLVNLTSPTLLLYNEILPKDGPNRRNFLYLVEILQTYKSAFSTSTLWAVLNKRLQKVLEIDPMERTEEKGLLIERALVLIRNILHVPSSPYAECRADNDASLHDQVVWSLQQAGILDLILYIIGSEHENQYHFHTLEIICLIYREQEVESLATVSLQRSATEKHLDEKELISARKRESVKNAAKLPPGRHSRFGGTYTIRNIKSISNRDIICHQSLHKAVSIDFDSDKTKQKQSFRVAKDYAPVERRSAFSIRLFLRQFAVEVLQSSLNSLIRQVRRTLERNSFGHDDSYLLWAIKFFLEYNRKSSFELALVSEAMTTTTFHWVVTRIQHHSDMLTSDKKNVRLWQRRLHIAVQAYKELLLSLVALQKIQEENAMALFKMLLNNVCYVHEFRETVFHTLANYNENQNTKSYLRDVVEVAHIFFKLLERFCNGRIIVQELKKRRKKSKAQKKNANKQKTTNNEIGSSEDFWADLSPQISSLLSMDKIDLPEDEHPLPFDATLDVPMDEQKDICMVRIHNLLSKLKLEQAIILLRSAREIWPGSDGFGTSDAHTEDELWLLWNIFMCKLRPDSAESNEKEDEPSENESDEDDEEEIDRRVNTETEFKFDDFIKRLVNPKIVRACTVVLSDWEALPAETIKSAVTILYRIAFVAKMPMMLCQMSLFRTFQHVLNTPRDKQYDEIRRLANYVIRQFVEVAVKNPKIYAELLFYKNIRESNDIESGYTDDGNDFGLKKTGWTEEQLEELRQLYQENQENPSTEQDVIDWILNNLIEKNRTRRAVIKKLKEMNLIFKAPTRKSVHAGVSKNVWRYEEDNQLKELYETNRLNENCLDEIMQVFKDKRSKNNVIKRMITLGLIANRSEIQPNKRKKSESKRANNESSDGSDNDNESSDNESNGYNKHSVKFNNKNNNQAKARPSKLQNVSRAQSVTDVVKARQIMSNLSEQNKTQLAWIVESLNDAAEDVEAGESDLDELDDGIPLVSFQMAQKEALKTPEIEDLLTAIGLQKPTKEMEMYWRIPINLNAFEIRKRAKLLAGDLDAMDEKVHEYEKNSSEESDDEIATNRLKQHARLVYRNSDDENETLVADSNPNENEANSANSVEHSRSSTPDVPNDPQDGNENPIANVFDSEYFNSQSIRQRLAGLGDSEPMDDVMELNSKTNKRNRFSMIENDASSGSDDDDIGLITSFRMKKAKIFDDDDDDNE